MKLLVSPYHLTSREAPMMAAALLARQLYTFMPVPEQLGPSDVQLAMRRSPRYMRMLESWRWAVPLFMSGLAHTLDEPGPPAGLRTDAAADVRAAAERMSTDPSYGEIRTFLHDDLFANERAYLDTISQDVLKGGPDPGVSIPVAAGLDAFAAAHSMLVMRAGAPAASGPGASLAQRVEGVLGTVLFSFAMPILTEASANMLLDVRDELSQELATLRAALTDALAVSRVEAHHQATRASAGPKAAGGANAVNAAADSAELRRVAGEYARAFEVVTRDLIGHDDDSGRRVTAGTVSVIGKRLSVESAIVSSVAALRQARARGGVRESVATEARPRTRSATVETLLIAPIGRVRRG